MNDKALTIIPDDIKLPKVAEQRGIEPHIWSALKQSYKSSDQMLLTLWDYCAARGLDPIKKPVHVVKTWDSDVKALVETIWEGIGSFRITASRTGQYAGSDEPVFGPDVTNWNIVYPEWCKFTVHRMIGGTRCPFTVVVRWLEHYASKKDGAPNAMWVKRPYGQLAKCAEAQALRSAFPEEIGSAPAAEEIGEEEAKDVTPETPRPRAEDFTPAKAEEPTLLYDLVDEVGEVLGSFSPVDYDKTIGTAINRLAKAGDVKVLQALVQNNTDALKLMAAEGEKERIEGIREFYSIKLEEAVKLSNQSKEPGGNSGEIDTPKAGVETWEGEAAEPPTEFIWVSTNGRENKLDDLDRWVTSVSAALGRCPDVGMLDTSRKNNATTLAELHMLGGIYADAVDQVEGAFASAKEKLIG